MKILNVQENAARPRFSSLGMGLRLRCCHHLHQPCRMASGISPDCFFVPQVKIDAPYYQDPPPQDQPGSVWELWNFEVVEVFIVGRDNHYLE